MTSRLPIAATEPLTYAASTLRTLVTWAGDCLDQDRHPQAVLEEVLQCIEILADDIEASRNVSPPRHSMSAAALDRSTVIQVGGHIYGRGGENL